jgi:SAM-dependent methyltransferase
MTSAPGPRRACPACGAPVDREPAVRVEGVPILLNVLVGDPDEALAAPRARLELCGCDGCGFVWNAAFEGVPYDERYQVDQSRSERFAAHLDEVAARIETLCDELHDGLGGGPGAGRSHVGVVEVGCGQGVFLGILGRRLGARLAGAHGFDPAFRGDTSHLPEVGRVTPSELDERAVHELTFAPDVVVTRHTIEHVPDPAAFLRSIHAQLAPRGPFSIVIETPDVGWTLRRGLLHDFCYEHCSLHSGAALEAALRRAGFGAGRVERVFSGEYLLATAPSACTGPPEEGATPQASGAGTAAALRGLGERFVAEHRARLERDRARGPVAVWGGAGKGALFLFMVDPDRALVEVVVDIHPAKAGSFLPGTAHPVVSPEQARALGVRTLVVANGNYADEIGAYCRRTGWDATIWAVGEAREATPA